MTDVFAVVKYDVTSFTKDLKYSDLSVQAPEIVDEFEEEEKAKAKIDELRKSSAEIVDIELANGGHYNGPKYIYKIAVTR